MREKNFLMPQTKFEMEGGPTKLGRFGEGGGGLAMQSTGPNSTNIGTLFFFFLAWLGLACNCLKISGSKVFYFLVSGGKCRSPKMPTGFFFFS